MNRILQSSWFAALLGCLLYLGVTVALFKPSQFQRAIIVHAQSIVSPDDDPSWRFRNPEFDQWLNDLKQQKEALAVREQQLNQMQTRLEAERQELNAVTQTVYQVQSQIDKSVIRITAQEVDNLKKQSKLLSNMSPEAAAALVKEMPEDEAVRILFSMKTDVASPVLEALSKMGKGEAAHAASLTEGLHRTLPPETATK